MRDLNDLRYPNCQDITSMADRSGWDEVPVVLEQLGHIRWILASCKETCNVSRAVKVSGWIQTWEDECEALLGFVV